MTDPVTPQKKGDIPRILSNLNLRWDLDLPVIENLQSPSKSSIARTPDGQLVKQITFLYFRNRQGLQEALDEFECNAKVILSSWRLKPAGDVDVVPRKPGELSAIPPNVLTAGRTLSSDQRARIKELLTRFIGDAYGGGAVGNSPASIAVVSKRKVPQDSIPELSFSSAQSLPQPRATDIRHDTGQMVDIGSNTKHQNILPYDLGVTETQSTDYLGSDSIIDTIVLPEAIADDMEVDMQRPETPIQQMSDGSPVVESYGTPPEALTNSQLFDLRQDTILISKPGSSVSASRKRPATLAEDTSGSRKVSRSESKQKMKSLEVREHGLAGDVEVTMSKTLELRNTPSGTSASTSFNSRGDLSQADASEVPTAQTSFESRETEPQASKAKANVRRGFSKTMSLGLMQWNGDREADVPTSTDMERSTSDPGSQMARPGLGRLELPEFTLQENLKRCSPFSSNFSSAATSFSYRVQYEVLRVSLDTGVPQEIFYRDLRSMSLFDCDDYNIFWGVLSRILLKQKKKAPPKSNANAWGCAQGKFNRVRLAGVLQINHEKSQPFLSLRLKPLDRDASNRLTNKFGSDRLLYIQIPAIEAKNLTSELKPHADNVRSLVINWLLDQHIMIGRRWEAFYVRPVERPKIRRKDIGTSVTSQFRVYLFGFDSPGMGRNLASFSGSQACEVEDLPSLLDWIISPEENLDQQALKFFTRIQLAVSTTTPTLVFAPWQIKRTKDAFANEPHVRDINRPLSVRKNHSNVMNDGCALISSKAARLIAERLNLSYIPSAFQGRIGGAKGMWMIDTRDQRVEPPGYFKEDHTATNSDPNIWIEITDSQTKFVQRVDLGQDPAWRTFEVHGYSKSLKESALNYQLIPILMENGVLAEVFHELAIQDITTESQRLKAAMQDSHDLVAYLQRLYPRSAQLGEDGTMKWIGGIPEGVAQRIMLLAQSGFIPAEQAFMSELCRDIIKKRRESLLERGSIPIAQSTSAYILADPLDVLDEGECYLCFSSPLTDEQAGSTRITLHDLDVLVTRYPAHMPSDIQKLRAVFKPELEQYKDVLIFPSRGTRSIADKLSGGDYDGDKATIFWDPRLVTQFKNADETYQPPPAAWYGITEDLTKVRAVYKRPREFVRLGFEFNMKAPMVGAITNYLEGLSYDWRIEGKQKPLSSRRIMDIAILVGYIVDAPKNGFKFGDEEWRAFKKARNLPMSVNRPAYKVNIKKDGPCKHPIDTLLFDVCLKYIDSELTDFNQRFGSDSGVRWYDPVLTDLWNAEEKFAERNEIALKPVLGAVKDQINALIDHWVQKSHSNKMNQEDNGFRLLVEESRKAFLAIEPPEDCDAISVKRWSMDFGDERLSSKGSWNLLKASCFFKQTYGSRPFLAWWVCGYELAQIKAAKTGGARVMIPSMYDILKVDKGAVKRRGPHEPDYFADEGEAEENDFDEMESQLFSDALEYQ